MKDEKAARWVASFLLGIRTAGVRGEPPREWLTKRNQIFGRENALNRNVANRPLACDVGRFLQGDFEFETSDSQGT
jgi:hypothetical protein